MTLEQTLCLMATILVGQTPVGKLIDEKEAVDDAIAIYEEVTTRMHTVEMLR